MHDQKQTLPLHVTYPYRPSLPSSSSSSPSPVSAIPKSPPLLLRRWKGLTLTILFLIGVQLVLQIKWYEPSLDHTATTSNGPTFAEVEEEVVTPTGSISKDPVRVPLTDLGVEADDSYILGDTSPSAYIASAIDFVQHSLPPQHQIMILDALPQFFPNAENLFKNRLGDVAHTMTSGSSSQPPLPAMIDFQHVWQTNKDRVGDLGGWLLMNPNWEWSMLDDRQADEWIDRYFPASEVKAMWHALPLGIMRADTLRYLLLLVHGGVYSDVDTACLKPISTWASKAVLWKDGKDWLIPPSETTTLESMKESLGPPSFVIGVEADIGSRPDWHMWYARPLQLVQWTLASTPSHPILLDVISRIVNTTNHNLPKWLASRDAKVAQLRRQGDPSEVADRLMTLPPWADSKDGGLASVMEWTGPGVFTDSAFRYLNARYNFTWADLRGLREPLRVGDVAILPVTGFSPGVGQFGAGEMYDPQAMVHHRFAGSWKDDRSDQRKPRISHFGKT
ncbi:membrane-bound alpha-1,6- mannosyltransferase Initiation-specific [Tulasnella sp. 330]|nr:membrane-bound alpha-1,6- mannosyltransferase Initiation-specific [Tulasnella sp. 330]